MAVQLLKQKENLACSFMCWGQLGSAGVRRGVQDSYTLVWLSWASSAGGRDILPGFVALMSPPLLLVLGTMLQPPGVTQAAQQLSAGGE